jgi:hypothetical protein
VKKGDQSIFNIKKQMPTTQVLRVGYRERKDRERGGKGGIGD